MKMIKNISLKEFNFSDEAYSIAKYLTKKELDKIEDYFTELYPSGMDEDAINDMFTFDFDENLSYQAD